MSFLANSQDNPVGDLGRDRVVQVEDNKFRDIEEGSKGSIDEAPHKPSSKLLAQSASNLEDNDSDMDELIIMMVEEIRGIDNLSESELDNCLSKYGISLVELNNDIDETIDTSFWNDIA